jgi:hypothetical protein
VAELERSAGGSAALDLLTLPDNMRAEVLAGEIVTAPAPLPRHSKAQRALARFIGGPYDDDDDRRGPGGWWILLEVDVRLSAHDIVRSRLTGSLPSGMNSTMARGPIPSPARASKATSTPPILAREASQHGADAEEVYRAFYLGISCDLVTTAA